jgi:hypothetical protein
MVNYFDSLGKPSEASLFIDNQKTNLALTMGTDSAGSYDATVARASSCRYYYFTFTDVKAKQWRYPETGYLMTQGEGTCAKDFVPAASLVVDKRNWQTGGRKNTVETYLSGSILVLKMDSSEDAPYSTSILTVQGKVVKVHRWQGAIKGTRMLFLSIDRPLADGTYYVTHLFSDGVTIMRRLVVLHY